MARTGDGQAAVKAARSGACPPSQTPRGKGEGGTRWVTFGLPRAWHIQTHIQIFFPALLQDVSFQPPSPTKSPSSSPLLPIHTRGSPALL